MIFYHYEAKLLLKKISHAIEKQLGLVHLNFKNFVFEILKVNNHHQFRLDEALHKEKIKRQLFNKYQKDIFVYLYLLQNLDKLYFEKYFDY